MDIRIQEALREPLTPALEAKTLINHCVKLSKTQINVSEAVCLLLRPERPCQESEGSAP
jgi:hypothetical protein